MRLIDVEGKYCITSSDNTGYAIEIGNGIAVLTDKRGMIICEFVLDDIPTAYDVDKVVEQLESEAKRWQESGEAYEDKTELGVAKGYRLAIKDVKKGGVNE